MDMITQTIVWLVPAVIAITLHEAAHGWMANRFGDDTALRLGRVSFNPLRHVDPMGTIVLPGLLILLHAPFVFGYAKPVPVNFRRLRHPKRDMIWVAGAGPGINIAIALLCGLLLNAGLQSVAMPPRIVIEMLANGLLINVVLAVFNMLPLPPLDGGRVMVGLLPPPYDLRLARIERYGMAILIGLLLFVPLIGYQLGVNLDVLPRLLGPPVEWIASAILSLTGAVP